MLISQLGLALLSLVQLGRCLKEQAPLTAPVYDEVEIAGLYGSIVKALERLGAFQQDEVVYAPAGGHDLNTTLMVDWPIDAKVLSLMRRLPVPTVNTSDRGYLQGGRRMIDFTNAEELKGSRTLSFLPRIYQVELRPVDLILFDSEHSMNGVLILDTETSLVRLCFTTKTYYPAWKEFEDNVTRSTTDFDEIQKQLMTFYQDYMSWPAQPAAEYLQGMLNRVLNGSDIPLQDFVLEIEWNKLRKSDMKRRRSLQRILLEEYHWPSADFNEKLWRDNRDQLHEVVTDPMVQLHKRLREMAPVDGEPPDPDLGTSTASRRPI